MAVVHISEAEAMQDPAGLFARVRRGDEVVIDGAAPIAMVTARTEKVHIRLLSESLRLARESGATAVPDEAFAQDVEAGVASHREALDLTGWD